MALARELGKARHPTRTYVVYFIAKCASQKIADAPPLYTYWVFKTPSAWLTAL